MFRNVIFSNIFEIFPKKIGYFKKQVRLGWLGYFRKKVCASYPLFIFYVFFLLWKMHFLHQSGYFSGVYPCRCKFHFFSKFCFYSQKQNLWKFLQYFFLGQEKTLFLDLLQISGYFSGVQPCRCKLGKNTFLC